MTLDQAVTAPSAVGENYSYCETLLKERDRPAWLATLFAPAEHRPALHALGAFVLDVRSIPDKVREPLAGELRMQWWTDALEGQTRGDVSGHPIAAALTDTLRRYQVSPVPLTGFLDVERDALYDETVETLGEFDTRADRAQGALIAARAEMLAGPVKAKTERAAALAGRIMAVLDAFAGLTLNRQQALVPLELLRKHRIGVAELRLRKPNPAVSRALADLRGHAEHSLEQLRALRSEIDPEAGPAFLTTSVAAALLQRSKKPGFQPFSSRLDLPQWRKQWIMWRAAGRNGIA